MNIGSFQVLWYWPLRYWRFGWFHFTPPYVAIYGNRGLSIGPVEVRRFSKHDS